MTRRRGNVFMNPAGWAYATPQGSLDGAASAPTHIDPTDWGTVVAAFYSDLGVTITGSGLSTWEDTFGDGNDLTQTTDADRLTRNVADADFNGEDSFTSDGTSQHIDRLVFVGGDESQPLTIVSVTKLTSTTGLSTLFDGSTSGERAMFRNNNSQTNIFAGTAVVNLWTANTSISLEAVYYNGASSKGYKNGVLSSAASTPGANVLGGFTLGDAWNAPSTENFGGKIGAVIIFRGALSDANLNGVMNDLQTKYGGTWADI